MALFEKKFCDLCGEKVNLLTRQKLEDGFLCSDCKHKLSSLSRNWDDRTISDVKAHLAAREANKAKYAQFSSSSCAGKENELMVDATHRQFCFAIGRDYSDGNPEVFDFSQLQSFWLEETVSTDNSDSDHDGIPDSRDNFNNVTGRPQNGNNMFGGLFGNNMQSSMMAAPMNVQQYIRRSNNSIASNSVDSYVSALKAHICVNHPYINEIEFYIDSSISKNNASDLMQAYNIGAQLMQLCEQIKGVPQQGFAQQPMQQQFQQGFVQQPMQQQFQQGFAQQPMQTQYQQPMNQGYAQQPVQPQYQQPMQQAAPVAAVMPFCPSCGSQNTSGTTFCPNCGSSLNK